MKRGWQWAVATLSSGIHLALSRGKVKDIRLFLSLLPHIRDTNGTAHLLGPFRTSSVNILHKHYTAMIINEILHSTQGSNKLPEVPQPCFIPSL
jgi:hypothetical protein